MAPGEYYLPLLPLGPDGVCNPPPHKTRPSTPLIQALILLL